MKRLFSFLFLLLLLYVSTLSGAIALVQSSATADGTTPVTSSFTNTPTSGNLLVCYAIGSTGIANASIANGWTLAVSALRGSTNTVSIWYKVAGASESKDVTITWTDSTFTTIKAFEYSGLTAPVLDKIANHDGDTMTTSWSSGTTATTTAPIELCVAAFRVVAPVSAESWSNSFATVWKNDTNWNFIFGSLVTSSAAAMETTISWTTSTKAAGAIATFMSGSGEVLNGASSILGLGMLTTTMGWLHTDGRWIKDSEENTVTLRGVHMYLRKQNEEAKYIAAKAMGANCVRLAFVKYDIENPGANEEDNDKRGLVAMDAAIGWAHDAGLMVILDQQLWSDAVGVYPAPSTFLEDTDLQDEWLAMWQTIVARYVSDPTVIGIDLMNEPNCIEGVDVEDHHLWEPIAETAVTALKLINPNLLFCVAGWGTLLIPGFDDVDFLQTSNVVYTEHIYYDTSEGLPLPEWAQAWRKAYSTGDLSGGLSAFTDYLDDRFTVFTDQDIPVWIGEIGFLTTDPYWQTQMEDELTLLDQLGLSYTLFCYGVHGWALPFDIVDEDYVLTTIGTLYSDFIQGDFIYGAGELLGLGILTIDGMNYAYASSPLLGVGILTSSAKSYLNGNSSLLGLGIMTSLAKSYLNGDSSLLGLGILASSAKSYLNGSSPILGLGILSATGGFYINAKASFLGLGIMKIWPEEDDEDTLIIKVIKKVIKKIIKNIIKR